MESESLDEDLMRALRALPDQTLRDLADSVGLPRTTFGRPLTRRIRRPVEQLVSSGLVEEHHGRFRLSQHGRRTLAESATHAKGRR